MKAVRKYRNLGLFLSCLLVVGVVLSAFGGKKTVETGKAVPLFSFINSLPGCHIMGFKQADAQIRQFEKFYKIKNPNYFPWHKGFEQKLNWQLGLFVSKAKKQVETHAALFTPRKVQVTTPGVKVDTTTFFSFSAAVVSANKKNDSAVYLFEALDKDGALLLRRTFSVGAKAGKWREYRISLAALAGKEVRLRLRVKCDNGVFPFWGEPVVYHKKRFVRPNVIVIMVDAMRYDAMGCYGSTLGATPNIDRYAKKGVVFECSVANANWTRPSELSMFTSVYPKDQRINQLDFPVSQRELDYFYKKARFETIPSAFKRNGYRTRGIINNIFLQSFTGTGVDIGFDWMTDYRTINRDTRDITADAIAWVRKHKDNPYFMFLNYNTPHKPYSAPERFFRQLKDDPRWRYERRVKEYLAEIAFADHYVGKLLDTLKREGLLKNTVVVINADHGEVLWPFHNHSTVYSKYTRFGHSLTMLDEEVRVPFILYYPEKVKPRVVKQQVQLLDLFPTLVDLCGLQTGPQYKKQIKGNSLLPYLQGRQLKKIAPVYIQGFMMEGLRTSRYKYVYRPPGFDMIGPLGGPVSRRVPEELYDLKNDPQEKRSIARTHPELLQKMRKLFTKYRDKRIANYLLLKAGKRKGSRFEGTISTDGVFFVRPGKEEKGVVLSADGKNLRFSFSLASGKQRKLKFEIHPDYAPISFAIYENRKRVSASELYIGQSGIACLGLKQRVDNPVSFRAAQSPSVPLPVARGEGGVYFFREPDKYQINWSSDTTKLSTEIKTVLRDWGYVQR